MSAPNLISLFLNILLGIIIVYLVFKTKLEYYTNKVKENRRETERQRIRQVVEEVLKEIVKDND